MVLDFFRGFISDNYNYIPSFTRIWESARKEIRIKDVKKIKSSRQALMFLKKEQSRLEFELDRVPAVEIVKAEPEIREKQVKLAMVRRWRRTLSARKFPRAKFDEFVGKMSEMLVYVDYVNKKGKRVQYIRENNPWSDNEMDRVKSLYKQGYGAKAITKRFNKITKEQNWLPRSKGSITSKIRKMRKKKEL